MTKINALLQRGLKKFWASKSGGVLIYIAFGLPILLGAMLGLQPFALPVISASVNGEDLDHTTPL